jgi:hypothetical protein
MSAGYKDLRTRLSSRSKVLTHVISNACIADFRYSGDPTEYSGTILHDPDIRSTMRLCFLHSDTRRLHVSEPRVPDLFSTAHTVRHLSMPCYDT